MPLVPDYYALLGVSPDAAGDVVRRAYREGCIRTGMAAVRRPANGCGRSTRRDRCCGMRTAGPITTAVIGRAMVCSIGWRVLPETTRREFG